MCQPLFPWHNIFKLCILLCLPIVILFLFVSSISLHNHHLFIHRLYNNFLYIHLLMDIWLVFILGLIWIKWLIHSTVAFQFWMKRMCKHMLSFHLCINLGVEWLDSMLSLHCQIGFHSGFTAFSSTSNAWELQLFHVFSNTWYCQSFSLQPFDWLCIGIL